MGRCSTNPNLNEYGELHFKYRQQMQFLKELADELGVVMFRPSYHAQTGDCNTVLFYFKEDDEYNRKVDRENPGLSLETKNQMYRRQFFSFANTDCNGLFSHDFANFGRIDLRGLCWQEKLGGALRLAYYRARQNRYIAASGGVLALREADDTYNDLNRNIIEAFRQFHGGTAFIGSVNYYDEDRQKLISGELDAIRPTAGELVYNFGCDFIIPKFDVALNEMVRDFNKGPATAQKATGIMKLVEKLGGLSFIWY